MSRWFQDSDRYIIDMDEIVAVTQQSPEYNEDEDYEILYKGGATTIVPKTIALAIMAKL